MHLWPQKQGFSCDVVWWVPLSWETLGCSEAFIAKRKKERLQEKVELFDDWLLRHASTLPFQLTDLRADLCTAGKVQSFKVEQALR